MAGLTSAGALAATCRDARPVRNALPEAMPCEDIQRTRADVLKGGARCADRPLINRDFTRLAANRSLCSPAIRRTSMYKGTLAWPL